MTDQTPARSTVSARARLGPVTLYCERFPAEDLRRRQWFLARPSHLSARVSHRAARHLWS